MPYVAALDLFNPLPLFPLMMLGIIWLAPWEPWVWRNVPKTIAGPYLLYCAFAFWHFRAHSWIVLLFVTIGVLVCAVALKEILGRGKLLDRAAP